MATWDKTKPSGSDSISQGDDIIRNDKEYLEDTLSRDHNFPGTYGVDAGEHKKVTLREQSADPSSSSDKGILYTKDVGGVTELFYIDSSGNVKQLTSGGKLNVESDEAVLLTGDQTIGGVKTFSSIPVLPASDPTSDNQAARKAYVDSKSYENYNINDHISILTGTVSNGGTIPLPSGYTQDQCKWIVSVGNLTFNNWDCEACGSWYVKAVADENREVSLCFGRDCSHFSGSANYMIIGIK
ncbi:hypothetical protein DRN98_08325 [Methanosarcinales archaeon]|nr:MAG: hypothetical protein DRN98_08325 [Methanosarcinales archaeon]